MGIRSPYHQIFLLTVVCSCIAIGVTPSISAQGYYADLTISVDPSGYVTIEGDTNYANLTIKNTEMYSSKQQNLWLLNITKPQIFSEFIYTVTLPNGASINYIKSTGSIHIEENLGNLLIKGFGENESFSIVIQYQIKKNEGFLLQDAIVYLLLFSAVICVSVLLVFMYRREKKKGNHVVDVLKHDALEDWKGLNHRQKQILTLLKERHVPLTQTDIQKELQIPKASVSRNIHGLERRGLIEKESIGMSNLIRLKKS